MLLNTDAAILPLLLRLDGVTAVANLGATTQTSTSPSWLPIAGAVGAVLAACIAAATGLGTSRYTLKKQGEYQQSALFAAAADKLGHAEAPTRMAGVYAMAALADDWKSKQQTCIDVLCGYMRMPYQPFEGEPGFRTGEKEVRHSLIRIVRDHLRDDAKTSWRGRIFMFHRATIDGGDLSGIKMSGGYMSFDDAEFISGIVDFRHSEFSDGTLKFQKTRFTDCKIYFRHCNFKGAVDLSSGSFTGATIDLRDLDKNSVRPNTPTSLPQGTEILLSSNEGSSPPDKHTVPNEQGLSR